MRKEDSNVSLIKLRDSKILKRSAEPEVDYRLLGEQTFFRIFLQFVIDIFLCFVLFFDKGLGSHGNDKRLYHIMIISSHTPIARFWQVIAISCSHQ